jgi:hypothetical protein
LYFHPQFLSGQSVLTFGALLTIILLDKTDVLGAGC